MKMKKILKVTGIVLLSLIIIGIAAFAVYWYKNVHWYDKYEKALTEAGAVEKQVTLPNGNVINYGEVENDKPALLLIHGQMGEWEDYALSMPELSKNWHIYAVDCYGHGQSTHEESLYYIDVNCDDIIWFIDNVIGGSTVVSGHSSGALMAAYIGAYGGNNVSGVILEDPPVFSTEGEGWEDSFAYKNSFKSIHEYIQSDRSECWEAYDLRRCYWGELFMKNAMPKIADYAQKYHDEHPGEHVKIGFLPSSVWGLYQFAEDYDFMFGEHFYDLSWNNGYTHEKILSDIEVPCIYIHAKENLHDNGTYLCAASREQAERAVGYIGDNCTLVESDTSDHAIHTVHMDFYIDTVNSMLNK